MYDSNGDEPAVAKEPSVTFHDEHKTPKLNVIPGSLQYVCSKLGQVLDTQDNCREDLRQLLKIQLSAQQTLDELAAKVMGVESSTSKPKRSEADAQHAPSPSDGVRAADSEQFILSLPSTLPQKFRCAQRVRDLSLSSSSAEVPIRQWWLDKSASRRESFGDELLCCSTIFEEVLEAVPQTRLGSVVASTASSLDEGGGDGAVWRTLMLHPQGYFRMTHDIFSLLFLCFDVFFIPVILAWEVPVAGIARALVIASWCYWLLDCCLSFMTGVFINGELEMRRGPVIKRYLRSWFVMDALVLISDLMSVLASFDLSVESHSGTSLLRMAKVGRFLRIARLVRLIRVSVIVNRISDIFAGSILAIVFDTVTPLAAIIVINHLLACLWFGLGTQGSSDTDFHWVDETVGSTGEGLTYRNTNVFYQYVTAFHWAMTQMTPGSMQVHATNSVERTANCICLLVGMLTFSSIISMLSARLMKNQAEQRDRAVKLGELRRFLRKKGLAPRLAVVIEKAATAALSAQNTKPSTVDDLHAVQVLPSSVHHLLITELARRHLVHPVFRLMSLVEQLGLAQLCQQAIAFTALGEKDILFREHQEASNCYVLNSGSMEYWPLIGEHTPSVKAGSVLAEAGLWCAWTHAGQAIAKTGCELLAIDACGFGKLVQRQKLFLGFAREYALTYTEALAQLREYGLSSDLESEFLSLAALLPTLPRECRLLSAAAALKQHRNSSLNSHRLWAENPHIEKSAEEARNDKCMLWVNSAGELERIVSIQAVRVRNKNNCILVEVGKCNADMSVSADFKLPGKKQLGGEAPQDTLRRVLDDTLAPYAAQVRINGMGLEETTQFSKRTRLATKYLRYLNEADCGGDLEYLFINFAGEVDQDPFSKRHRVSQTSSPGVTRRTATLMDIDTTKESLDGCFALSDSKGNLLVYAWFTDEAFAFCKTSTGEESLQRYFEDKKVHPSFVELARERHRVAFEAITARQPCAAPSFDASVGTASMAAQVRASIMPPPNPNALTEVNHSSA